MIFRKRFWVESKLIVFITSQYNEHTFYINRNGNSKPCKSVRRLKLNSLNPKNKRVSTDNCFQIEKLLTFVQHSRFMLSLFSTVGTVAIVANKKQYCEWWNVRQIILIGKRRFCIDKRINDNKMKAFMMQYVANDRCSWAGKSFNLILLENSFKATSKTFPIEFRI